jgi:serine/threonine protein phosphatase PrpC
MSLKYPCHIFCLQEHLLNSVYEAAKNGIYGADALHHVFMSTNADLRHVKAAYACGSTATTVIVDGTGITCANAGDSPAFIVGSSGALTEG